MPSDIINAIYYDTADSTTWVGSPEGLTYFKEKNIAGQSICNLVVENITISKTAIKVDSNNFSLKYNDNIDFQFVGISFRSGEEIIYHYKLQGLDTGYNTTTERFISYPSLPSGNYTLALYATNKFGVQSKIYNCSFYVHPPFWETWWFTIIEVLAIVIIVWAILYRRLKQKEKEYKRIADFEVQLTNMEQLALQAQMNPHFIFNCLNSIQQFILANETEKANKYLVLFSRLIRNTLDNSEKKNITLTSEIDYLQQYLMLEHLRFGDKFSYDIAIANDIISDHVDLPAMLLQPFVENSLRHGIRQLVDKNGMLNIEFHITNNYLICTIEDNGIGRAAAEKYKSNMHIEYQSKGMQLTAKRVDLLNTNTTNKISIEIIDLKDNADIATGTKVIVRIPV